MLSSSPNGSAHHEIRTGYGLAVLIYWGMSVYFCFSESMLSIVELHHTCRFCFRSRSYLASLRAIQPIQALTVCSIGLVLAYRCPLDRDNHLFIQSTQCVLRWVLTWIELAASWLRLVYIVEEIVIPNAKYCTVSFNTGPMIAIYTSIPIICYDIFLLALAVAILIKHLKERKEVKMKPNVYVITIVKHHIIYFVL